MLLVVSALVLVKPGLCFSQSEGGGTRLTLDESIRIALENNPGVETAERGRRAAQERIPQAKAQFGPDIDIIASHTLQGPTISFPTGLGTSTTIVPDSRNDYILQLSQTLYAGDSIPASRRAARLGAGVAADTLEDVRQDVVLRSKVAYFSVLRAEALRVVVAEALELAREHLRVANAHFDAGTVPKFDVLRSEVEVAQAEEFLVQADNAISLAGASFNSALGRPVDSPV
ncbi:MAG: hypothetical protein COZ05_12965, partial [Armatimonadetes bacterium CG_4_10_14_3_um_filter_59_10]